MPIPELRDVPVLVTGGAGFIGSHLVDELVRRAARVRVLDDFSTGRRHNLAHHGTAVRLVEGDLRDAGACREACRGAEYVFHLAALGSVPRSLADPGTTVEVNVGGSGHLFAAARGAGARRVVYASSSSVYGDSERLPKKEGEEGSPLSPYAASKRMTEVLAATFWRCYGLELVGLRYFNVYGPRQDPEGPYAAVVPRLFAACLSGQAPILFGDGEQTRDFTFVSDAVRATLLAAGAPRRHCGRAYNVGGGRRISINDLARAVRRIIGTDLEPRHAAARPGDVRHSEADLSLADTALGYHPHFELEAGLAQCLASFPLPPAGPRPDAGTLE